MLKREREKERERERNIVTYIRAMLQTLDAVRFMIFLIVLLRSVMSTATRRFAFLLKYHLKDPRFFDFGQSLKLYANAITAHLSIRCAYSPCLITAMAIDQS